MFLDIDQNAALTEAFALSLARWVPVALFSPVCGTLPLPMRVGVGVLAALWLSAAGGNPGSEEALAAPFTIQILYELALGVLIAVCVRLVFEGVWAAGALLDATLFAGGRGVGLGEAQSNAPLRAIAVLATLAIISAAGGVQLLFTGALSLHARFPLGADPLGTGTLGAVVELVGAVFVTALLLAGPVVAGVLLIDITMVALTKLVPRVQAVSLRTPAAVLVALLVLAAGGIWFMDGARERMREGFSRVEALEPEAAGGGNR
jgi:flagellar biosynthesis protein FliR